MRKGGREKERDEGREEVRLVLLGSLLCPHINVSY